MISASTPYSLASARIGAGQFAVVAAQAHDLEAHLVARDAGGGVHMGGVAEEEDALAGQIGAVDRCATTRAGAGGFRRPSAATPAICGHFGDEIAGGADADRHGLGVGLAAARAPCQRAAASAVSGYSSTLKCAAPRRAMSAGVAPIGAHDVHVDAHLGQQAGRSPSMSSRWRKPRRGGADQVAGDPRGPLHRARPVRATIWKKVSSAPKFSLR